MNIEKQVCTLEQAKRLKGLGLFENSVILWLDYSNNPHGPKVVYSDVMDFEKDRSYIYPAYTVAELGVMLPSETYTMRTGSESSEYANWEWVDDVNQNANGLYNTEAEARASFLIYLLENNLTTAEECNERLK